jgi:stage III sporulation protein AD
MNFITSLLAKADVSSENDVILFKVVGICFLTEFTCDTVKESGLQALSGNIALAGKIVVLITALPMFTEIMTLVTNLVAGE